MSTAPESDRDELRRRAAESCAADRAARVSAREKDPERWVRAHCKVQRARVQGSTTEELLPGVEFETGWLATDVFTTVCPSDTPSDIVSARALEKKVRTFERVTIGELPVTPAMKRDRICKQFDDHASESHAGY